ncbi:uncharacterized protein LOC134256617 isoform X8 [Saccostrea cucullata]|uniref:uncharacterized protein LOC134256617 isoform X8 n=1 Tax=Saccostrea cuccullata TaxID=36930 RepID=UPI002ED326D0
MDKLNQSADVSQKQFENGKVEENEAEDGMVGTDEECRSTSAVKEADMDMESDYSDIPEWEKSELSDSDEMDMKSDDSDIPEWNDSELSDSDEMDMETDNSDIPEWNDSELSNSDGMDIGSDDSYDSGIHEPNDFHLPFSNFTTASPVYRNKFVANGINRDGSADEETKENDGQTIQESGGVPARVMDNCNHNDPTEQETLGLQGNAIIPILKGRNQQAYSVSPVPYAGCQQENIIQAVQETGVTDEESQENVGKAFQIEWSK